MPDEEPPKPPVPSPDEIVRWDQIPSTRWTLVGRAGNASAANPAETRSALEELLGLYLPVLRGHLVSTLRVHPDRVDDLLQGFLTDRVVERNLIGQADAARGRFRRFLLTALNRYVTDAHRRETAARRRPSGGAPGSLEDLPDPPSPNPTAAEHFDRLWANEVLAEVMRRTRAACKSETRMQVWGVLEGRILQPVTDGVPPMPHDRLAQRLGLANAAQSATYLSAGKQLFMQVFRQVVAEYVIPTGGDRRGMERVVDEEIQELWTIFAARPT